MALERQPFAEHPSSFRLSHNNPFDQPYAQSLYNHHPPSVGRSSLPYRVGTTASQYDYRRYTNQDVYDDPVLDHIHLAPTVNFNTNPFINQSQPIDASHIVGTNPANETTISTRTTNRGELYEQYNTNYNRNIAHQYQHDPRHFLRDQQQQQQYASDGNYYANQETSSYASYTTNPIKMEREEVIIEHSQLVAIAGNHNNNNETDNRTGGNRHALATGGPRPHHYTQVCITRLGNNTKKIEII